MSDSQKLPDVRVSAKVIKKYFGEAKSKEEIQKTIEKALEFYNENKNNQ